MSACRDSWTASKGGCGVAVHQGTVVLDARLSDRDDFVFVLTERGAGELRLLEGASISAEWMAGRL
jgi:hypothetical protein